MGDRAMLAKATRELEELYIGIPDESVDLTFAHLVTQKNQNGVAERKVPSIQPIQEENIKEGLSSKTGSRTSKLPRPYVGAQDEKDRKAPDVSSEKAGLRNIMGSSFVYDDFSGMNVIGRSSLQDGEGRRRPGIPHSNICTICSSYVHVFRHRCLVCGRVYCRQCVCAGMGEMTEGRKCVECLGARFSQR
ncbi:hypothetical protein GIB67_026567 [Kingdonia uniflora]|uniref:Uncharacterized protein n=1 Tax=Kingdonia uniflora TaxID=39325 RepID=A0A7J7NNA6_9MAGN|nr:hypothetical protein GIB67_026567 [Kingdonia uniflora]